MRAQLVEARATGFDSAPRRRADSQHPRDAPSRFGAWAPAKLPEASSSDPIKQQARAIGHATPTTGWSIHPLETTARFPRVTSIKPAPLRWRRSDDRAGPRVVMPGYLR